MNTIDPWGELTWLLSKIGSRKWRLVTCASFEPRSVVCSNYYSKLPSHMRDTPFVVRVFDPPSIFTDQLESKTDEHQLLLEKYLGAIKPMRAGLLDDHAWNGMATEIANEKTSILLDISTMPKRLFLFLVKRFMSMENVCDLVVCYTQAKSYKEGALSGDALPPAALPGFGRISSETGGGTMIVSVGYMAFNLAELLQQSRGKSLKFIFPFPPGSPSFRRSWRLLHQLVPTIPIQTDIQRVHSLDMFSLLKILKNEAENSDGPIDFIPLGPKPHSLAMALAAIHIGDRSEILYSQPRLYDPNYSTGHKTLEDGNPKIISYCLKRNHIDYT